MTIITTMTQIPTKNQSRKKLVPFPFQRQMVDEIHASIDQGDRDILVCAGTGSGKTFMAVLLIQERVQRGSTERVVFLVDLNVLIDQTLNELESFGLNCVAYQGSRSKSSAVQARLGKAQVIVASCQTLLSRNKQKGFDDILGEVTLVIADEAHTVAFSGVYARMKAHYQSRGTIFIGLSATIKTQSPGDRYLGRLYEKVIISPSMPEMIKMGRCVPFRLLSPSGVLDVAKLHIDEYTGDFNLEEQGKQLEAQYPQVVKAWKRYGEQRSTCVYCPTLESAGELVQEFEKQGISAEVQTGLTPMGFNGLAEHAVDEVTRASQNYRLDTGVTKVVCSVGTQVKGWNLPSLGCIIMVRATRSLQLAIQVFGRGLRTCPDPYWNNGLPKPDCILLDFGGNLERFDPISPNNYGSRKSDYNISQIPFCNGSVTEKTDSIKEKKDDVDEPDSSSPLTEELELYPWFDSLAVQQIRFLRQVKKSSFENSLREGFVGLKVAYHPNEAERHFLAEFGFLPRREWHLGAVFGAFPTEEDRTIYRKYLLPFAPHEFWLEQKLIEEFGVDSGTPLGISPQEPWHKILGVSPRCKIKTAQKAFERLSKKYSVTAQLNPRTAAIVEALKKAWKEAQLAQN